MVIDTAIAYLRAGLCVLPAILAEKRPALSAWKQYQKRLPTEHQLQQWLTSPQAICLLTGAVSGNLELIDFDFEAELYTAWAALVEEAAPGCWIGSWWNARNRVGVMSSIAARQRSLAT